LLVGAENLLRRVRTGLHADAPGQHRHLRAFRLPAHFKFGAQHSRFAVLGVHDKRLARVADLKKRHATSQLHMALAAAEVHRNGTVGIQRDPGLVRQCQGPNLTWRTDIIGAQVVDPARRLPPGEYPEHQQQARRDGHATGPLPNAVAFRDVHGRQVALHNQRLFFGQPAARHFAQLPHHLGVCVGLGMGGVGVQPAAEGGLIAAVGLVVQYAQPCQRGALLLGRYLNRRTVHHGAFPVGGSRKLALQASRARIICFSTALWDTPMTLAISA